MALRIREIRIPLRDLRLNKDGGEHGREDEEQALRLLQNKCAKRLGIPAEKVGAVRIVRHSLDARKKPEILHVFTVDCEVEREERVLQALQRKKRANGIDPAKPSVYRMPEHSADAKALRHRPVVVGFGPCGMLAALLLARQGYRPLVLERGACLEERLEKVENFWNGGALDPAANVQFGEGGAGTFSDGKLASGVTDKSGRIDEVLRIFAEAGADPSIRYEAEPHVGTDRLHTVVKNIREEIQTLGGEIRFRCRMTKLLAEDGQVRGLVVEEDGKERKLPAQAVILAPGHSARDTFRMLHGLGIPMEAKSFAAGLRVIHPQSVIDGRKWGIEDEEERRKTGLPAASYKVTARAASGRAVYSFCMCPGGYVVNASSTEKMLAVNGMSYQARDGKYANAAVIGAVTQDDFGDDDVLSGVRFQENLEQKAYAIGNGQIPVEPVSDFLREAAPEEGAAIAAAPALKGACTAADLRAIFPKDLAQDLAEGMEHFEREIPGFCSQGLLAGVETRTSSPVRILRGEDLESELRGLFPCGEGCGYAGGITSAAVDGIKAAEQVIMRYFPAPELEAGRA